jgi:amino acid transporter
MLVAAGTISTAILLKGFAGYFYQLVPVAPWLSMTLLVFILSLIMLYGIKESVAAAGLFTIIEVGGLLFLIGSIAAFHPETFTNYGNGLALEASTWSLSSFAGIFAAAFLAFYAFVGFEDMVNIAEEVKNPQKAFPRAILISMATVTLLYLAVSVVSLGVLPQDVLSKSAAPLADAYHSATGQGIVVVTIVSLIATLNGMLVNIIMGSRFLYGMSSRGWDNGLV